MHACKPAIILAAVLFAAFCFVIKAASSSPPIDYFVYTSQLANSPQGTQTINSLLEPLDTIYNSSTKSNDCDNLRARKVLSLLTNYSHTHDNDLIDLQTTNCAWHLMEQQALLYMKNKIRTIKPFVSELLNEAQVSTSCKMSIDHWLDRLAHLDSWAMLMWNSWGQIPAAGFYEGSFTDLGSYKGCLSIDKSVNAPPPTTTTKTSTSSGSNDDNNDDDENDFQAQYCTLDFQPLVPTRPRFHSIFKKVLSVDDNGKLTGGDFGTVRDDFLRSKLSSHGFASEMFNSQNNNNINDLITILKPTSSEQQIDSIKYTKRTIVDDDPTVKHDASNRTTNQQGERKTIQTQALIELALKAQYFYYVKLRIGSCWPSKCSQQDIRQLAQAAGVRTLLQTSKVNCMKKEAKLFNVHQKVAIWILSSFACVAAIGTLVDLLGFKTHWLLVFSIRKNGKRLFDSENVSTHIDLGCIHGLRFFSMLWVIYGHTILYSEYQSFTHFYDAIEKDIANFILLPTLNANFSVDTFFVISGLLTTYVTWEITKGDARKFNKFAFAISRYIRLTPQLGIVILCFFLLPLFGTGPMYKQITEKEANRCYKNWPINFLYLQNYIDPTNLCIDPSWWLSIEMTFHMISIPIVIAMINNTTRGMIVNFVVAGGLALWGTIIHYNGGFAIQYLPSIPQRYEVVSEQTNTFFHLPYPHAASYFIGLALGYVLANRTIKKLSKIQMLQGWIVCAIGIVVPLWGSHSWNLGVSYTQLQASIYYNLCQVLWPIAISWIIFICSLGHGGIVESILSAKFFVPLGRVTYMTYLSHALIIYYHSASMNVPVEPSLLLFTYIFVANTVLALILGTLLTVVYESPILNLQKLLFSYLTRKFEYNPTSNRSPETA